MAQRMPTFYMVELHLCTDLHKPTTPVTTGFLNDFP